MGIVRLSGPDAVTVASAIFRSSRGRSLEDTGPSVFHGHILGPDSAPVDETIVCSSMLTPGSRATSDPVAMTMLLVSSCCLLPSAAATSTLPAETILLELPFGDEGWDHAGPNVIVDCRPLPFKARSGVGASRSRDGSGVLETLAGPLRGMPLAS